MEYKKIEDTLNVIEKQSKCDTNWLEMYKYACRYRQLRGNLLVPATFCVKKDGRLVPLGVWIQTQRKAYFEKKLNKETIDLLELIGMSWDAHITRWEETYACAKEYYEEHGDLLIPVDYSVEKNKKIINVGTWIQTQRKFYKSGELSKPKQEKLESIGMAWDAKIDCWDVIYGYAKEYYEEHGNLQIPCKYCIEKEGQTIRLGAWLANQRNNYKNDGLKAERIRKLESIGMCWDRDTYQWMDMYLVLQKYYEKNHHIMISDSYSQIDEEGNEIPLGKWLNLQKRLKRMKRTKSNLKKIELLDSLGMCWEFVDNESIQHRKMK